MCDKQSVLDKIRKLLALATSSNEYEALLAAERAQALLAAHNLTMQDIEIDRRGSVMIDSGTFTAPSIWKRTIGNTSAALCFCNYFYAASEDGEDRHNFVGLQVNIVAARYMFDYLMTTIERLARDDTDKRQFKSEVARQSHCMSFAQECSVRVCARIHYRMVDTKQRGTSTELGKLGCVRLPALADLYEQSEAQNIEFLNERFGELDAEMWDAELKKMLTGIVCRETFTEEERNDLLATVLQQHLTVHADDYHKAFDVWNNTMAGIVIKYNLARH